MDMEIKGIANITIRLIIATQVTSKQVTATQQAQLTQNAKHLNAATAAVVAKINQNNGSVKRRAVI